MPELERFRLGVGRSHDVKVGDIVGAVANEAELDSRYIGRVQLFDDHSTVELPVGMPPELLRLLQKVRVRNVPLAMERMTPGEGEEPAGGGRGVRPAGERVRRPTTKRKPAPRADSRPRKRTEKRRG